MLVSLSEDTPVLDFPFSKYIAALVQDGCREQKCRLGEPWCWLWSSFRDICRQHGTAQHKTGLANCTFDS